MTLVRYLSREIGMPIIASAVVLTALGLGLDLLDSAPKVVDRPEGGGLLRYAGLRVPAIALSIAPIALLAGATVGFLRLGVRTELTVVRAVGLGMRGVLQRLIPLCLVFGAGLYLLNEFAAPAAGRALSAEYGDVIEVSDPGRASDLWARTRTELIRIGGVEAGGTVMTGVTVFRLDGDGQIVERLDAPEARYSEGTWTLIGARRHTVEGGPVERFASLDLTASLMPTQVLSLLETPETIRAVDARAALRGSALQQRSTSFYEVRAQRAWAAVAAPFVMLLLAAPAGLTAGRDARGARLAVVGILLGFCFLAVDGVAIALGERGVIAAAPAVWAAPVLFSLLGFWLLLLAEG